MLSEKLKVNVTRRTAEILEKDAENFEFYKRDGRTLNKNALVTQLIVNYHERFRAQQEELHAYLKKTIGSAAHIAKDALETLCRTIAAHGRKQAAAPLAEKFACAVSVKPTRVSAPVIDYIERYLLEGGTLSEYFRNMFSSYAALPQDEREKIVFRPQYEALEEAVRQKRMVFLTTHASERGVEVSPFRITTSREELHCYLLAGQGGACIPLRLSRILSVTMLAQEAAFSQDQLDTFARMLAYGPQFQYAKREEEVLVQFTARGMDMFSKMYVHRPVPVRVENNSYFFACSHQQLFQYLVRFGKDAYVVRPASLRERIRTFHRQAEERYRSAEKHYSAIRKTDKP